MAQLNATVGEGLTATGTTVPRAPIQQLGAAPGTSDGVPGFDGNELEEEGLEFASSGEAAEAPRDGQENLDYDYELSPEMLDYITQADTSAREAANVLLVGIVEGTEREGPGLGAGSGREEAHIGSTPAYPGSQTPAMIAQTPGRG